MIDSAWLMALAVGLVREVGGTPGGGFYIDLLNLQWWQVAIGLITGLGLSPAPWIAGLATGRIQFASVARKDFERQIATMETAHTRELDNRDAYHQGLMGVQLQRYSDLQAANAKNAEAAERERARSEEVTDAALDLADVLRANTHVMASITEAAEAVEAERKP